MDLKKYKSNTSTCQCNKQINLHEEHGTLRFHLLEFLHFQSFPFFSKYLENTWHHNPKIENINTSFNFDVFLLLSLSTFLSHFYIYYYAREKRMGYSTSFLVFFKFWIGYFLFIQSLNILSTFIWSLTLLPFSSNPTMDIATTG